MMGIIRRDLFSEVMFDRGRVRPTKGLRRNQREVLKCFRSEASGCADSGGAQPHEASTTRLLQSKTLLAEMPPPAIATGRPAASFLPQHLPQTCN